MQWSVDLGVGVEAASTPQKAVLRELLGEAVEAIAGVAEPRDDV